MESQADLPCQLAIRSSLFLFLLGFPFYHKSQKGNCIEFIKNGNGSAGYAIYKRENFCSSMDFIFGYADWLNKENGLFFSTCSDMSKEKYHHGHKWTKEGLKKSRIMLRFFSNFIFYISNHITANWKNVFVNEETAYMRDYIYDEGVLKEVRFDRVSNHWTCFPR